MFQWARVWFCFCRIMLDKETWRKDYRFLFFKCSLVWFLYTAKCEFSSNFRVYIMKDWSLSRDSGATVLFVQQIFVSPHSQFNNMYSGDSRPDTFLLMLLESLRAVPQASQQASARTIYSTSWRPRSEKPLQTSGSRTCFFFPFSCFSISNQEAFRRSSALLLRIKAWALQKRPLFVLFALAGRIAVILDVAILCAAAGAKCKTRELPYFLW